MLKHVLKTFAMCPTCPAFAKAAAENGQTLSEVGGSGAQGSAEFAHDERMIQNIQSTAKVASHSLAFWPSCLAGLAPSLEGFFTKRSQIEAIEEILYMNVSTNMTCSVGGVCKPVQTSG